MEPLIGTPQCPHLGYDIQHGRPCCHADDLTRMDCGRFAPNPAARCAGNSSALSGIEAYYCTVLGTDALPAAALKLAAEEKARARNAAAPPRSGFRAPPNVSGQLPGRPAREQDLDSENPIIPTHTLKGEPARALPNSPCPCGSGKKHKKCCGRL